MLKFDVSVLFKKHLVRIQLIQNYTAIVEILNSTNYFFHVKSCIVFTKVSTCFVVLLNEGSEIAAWQIFHDVEDSVRILEYECNVNKHWMRLVDAQYVFILEIISHFSAHCVFNYLFD